MQKSAVLKERLVFRRNRLGLTQDDLAEKSGVSLRSISNYESGESLPNLEQLYKLASALNINAGYFLGEEPMDSVRESPLSELAGYSGLDTPALQKILADLSTKLAAGKFSGHERKHVLGNIRAALDELESRELAGAVSSEESAVEKAMKIYEGAKKVLGVGGVPSAPESPPRSSGPADSKVPRPSKPHSTKPS